MQLTNAQFQALIGISRVDVTSIDETTLPRIILKAQQCLLKLHTIEGIDGIRNLQGALQLLEGSLTRFLRAVRAPIPSYKAHPSSVDAFLDVDFLPSVRPADPAGVPVVAAPATPSVPEASDDLPW